MRASSPSADRPRLTRSLTAPKIAFLVVGAAAPLSAVVGTVPLALAIGVGPGVPAAFAFASLTLLCFSVGYAAMSRRIVHTGGFYSYVAHGLGRPPAIAGGLVGLIAYNALTIGMVGAFGYFTQLVTASHGLDLPWEVWAGAAILVIGVLGYRQIDLSARVLSLLTVGEIVVITLLVAAIAVQEGGAAFPATSFAPRHVLTHGLGVALMFAFMSFTGFESAANYGEETARPERSVPMATYASVLLIGAIYTVASWAAVGGIGPAHVVERASAELGDLIFGLGDRFLGSALTTTMQALMCTSLFGATLAMHNAANRYAFVLGRERVLPSTLGDVHARFGSPHRASVAQTVLTAAVCTAFALAGLDPYLNLATALLGLGTLAIVVLQAAAAVSVVGFFWRHPEGHWWRTVVAPGLGGAGLAVTAALLVSNFSLVTGTDALVVSLLPLLVLAAAVGGLGYGAWLRRSRPKTYARVARQEEAPSLCPGWPPLTQAVPLTADGDHGTYSPLRRP